MNILMLDGPAMLRAQERLFTSMGCRVTRMKSPQDAFDYLQKNEESVDLLVIDCAVPALNGLDIVRKVRSMECDTPILAMSGEESDPRRLQAMVQWGAAVMMKPVRSEVLAEYVTRFRAHCQVQQLLAAVTTAGVAGFC